MRSRGGLELARGTTHPHSPLCIALYARLEELRVVGDRKSMEALAWVCLHSHPKANFSNSFDRYREMIIDLRTYIPYLVDSTTSKNSESKDLELIRKYELYLKSLDEANNNVQKGQ